jgi:hypothetical protein
VNLKNPFFKILYFLSFLITLSACGYRLAKPVNPLINNINTIAIPFFKNKTFEPEAEKIFTYAFVNEFVESGKLKVVGMEDADAVLFVTVTELREDTIAFTRDNKAMEYRVYVSLDILLEERSTGNVLWKRKNLRHSEEFPVDFNIVMSETAKRASLNKLAEDLAERVHDSIMLGF